MSLPTNEAYCLKGHSGPVNALVFNTGCTYLLSGGADRSVRIWNPNTGMFVKAYSGHGKDVLGIAVGFDNSKFCTGSGDKQVFLWDVSAGTILRRFSGHSHRVNCVGFNAEATVIASGSYDASVRLWDCRSQSRYPIQILNESKDDVSSIQVVEHEILAGSIDGHYRIYDIRAGKLIDDHVGFPVTSACFSGDGNCILASSLDSTIRLFDKETGELLSQYSGHTNESYKLASCFTNSDSHVISGSEDGQLFYWDLVEGSVTHSMQAHTRFVGCVVYHEKEDILASCSFDGTIKIWTC